MTQNTAASEPDNTPVPGTTRAAATFIAPLEEVRRCASCEKETRAVLRRLRCSNGALQIKYQCTVCGAGTSNPLLHGRVKSVTDLQEWDSKLAPIRNEIARKNVEAELSQRKAQYREYLNSPAWASRRRQVLDREGGLCQGCRASDAVEVHHLTYAHVRAEFLFELVALCRNCHERYHGISPPWLIE